jgi:hypothetical protein
METGISGNILSHLQFSDEQRSWQPLPPDYATASRAISVSMDFPSASCPRKSTTGHEDRGLQLFFSITQCPMKTLVNSNIRNT